MQSKSAIKDETPFEKNYQERVCPENEKTAVFQCHLARYKFALQFVKNRVVLDAGCGTGYGAHYLSHASKEIIGIDISESALRYARTHFLKKNLKFEVSDLTGLTFENTTFDVVCCFDVIEHIEDYKKAIQEIYRVLKSDGLFIISTPNKKIFSDNQPIPPNPHHIREFYLSDFQGILRSYFDDVNTYGQKESAKVEKVFQGNMLTRLLSYLNISKIKKLLPSGLRHKIARFLKGAIEEDITTDDFKVLDNINLETCEYFVSVCKK
jgi:2-polyprenyl-3-methyl-5-hydroxy-6-metoxy-1,4-benzoquinol methylase